ncbi:MAG TPA: redoxin domain-containing protein [Gemmatimonadales bacterium]|nr:redoxin domain-containing protein [Gemmatimonadales bacterium]
MRGWLAVGMGLLCLAIWVGGCDRSAERAAQGANGASGDLGMAPDFTYTDLEGHPYQLSQLRDRTVIIDFWATWCPPCVFQPTELNAFWKRHRDSGKFQVLGLEVGGASVDEIHEWAAENHAVAEYPVLTGADEDLARRFGALGFPALVIVAPGGEIQSVHVGLTTLQELEEQVAKLGGDGAAGLVQARAKPDPSREAGPP